MLQPAQFRCMLLATLLLGGCAISKDRQIVEHAVNDYFVGDYASARQLLRPLADKTNEDFVLNNLRLGSATLVDYQLDEAEGAFLRAYEVMNSVGVNDGGRSLGAALVTEQVKVWKGEPFERAMANFYLGLIYYMRQDYANARGAFENAIFKLRNYTDNEQDYQDVDSNFALGYLMLAKSWQRLGRDDLAAANFQAATRIRPELSALADPPRNAQSNLLLVIDFGFGPRKLRQSDGDVVGFTPQPWEEGPIPQPQLLVDGRSFPLHGIASPTTDLLAVAQDRKWQSIDTIRTIKSALGTGLIAAGAYQGLRRRSQPQDAAALILAGLLLKASSQADIRQWEMLPRTVFLLPLRLPPGTHEITIDFPAADGLRQTWRNLQVPQTGEACYYFRTQRWRNGPYDWPPHPSMNSQAKTDGK